jgi:predicted RNase H-like HicB family nuclease
MTSHGEPVRLTIVYERDEQGWLTATIPAVPGTISTGRTRPEARENAIDALREMLATPGQIREGAVREDVELKLEFSLVQDRGLER